MQQRVRHHVDVKFRHSAVTMFPFPHVVIEDFLPRDVFELALAFNLFRHNAGEKWHDEASESATKSRTPYHARTQVNFHRGTADEREFWTEIAELFLETDWFVRLVMDAFPEYFALRFGEIALAPEFPSLLRRELFLQQHRPGYSIGPHTDVPERVFTGIFALADRGGFEEHGTELRVPRDPLVRCSGNAHHGPEGFDVRAVAPYRRNNFFGFWKTRQSFHSVRTTTEDVPNRRYGMQFQLIEPPGGLFRDLSEPDAVRAKI
jgi:hypothetical protein